MKALLVIVVGFCFFMFLLWHHYFVHYCAGVASAELRIARALLSPYIAVYTKGSNQPFNCRSDRTVVRLSYTNYTQF